MNGKGCSKCYIRKQTYTTEKFINDSSNIHNNLYDYSLSNYINSYTNITIICPIHGQFQQRPSSHVRGSGCYKCAKENLGFSKTKFKEFCIKNNGLGTLYVIRCWNENEEFFKIGITSNSIKDRFAKSAFKYQYEIIQEIQDVSDNIYDLEKLLHRLYNNWKYQPSIKFDGSYRECFKLIM